MEVEVLVLAILLLVRTYLEWWYTSTSVFIHCSYFVEPWPSTPGSRPQMTQPAAEKSLVEGPKVELSMCDLNRVYHSTKI